MNSLETTIAGFAGLATCFRIHIESHRSMTPEQFLRRAHLLLARLYLAGLTLPAVEAVDGSHDDAEKNENTSEETAGEIPCEQMTHDRWHELNVSLTSFIGDRWNWYAAISEPYDDPSRPEETAVVGSLADDLADIYRDLSNGLAMWEREEQSAAIWQWRFTFIIHWGEHALGALQALHALRSIDDTPFPNGSDAAEI